jgi:hypothetical protein
MSFVERLEGRALFASYAASTVSELISRINTSNNSAQADTITLAAGATFSLTAADNAANGPTGLPVISALGGGLTIIGNGATIEPDVNAYGFRLFDVAVRASLTLTNMTLQGGVAYGVSNETHGGAIHNQGALTLQGVTLQNNSTIGPGGYYTWGNQLVAAGPGMGGAVYSSGSLTMTGCVVRNNQAVGGWGASHVTIPPADPGNFPSTQLPATPGSDGFGGGVYIAGGSASISNTTFSSNTAQGGHGGGGFTVADGGNGYGGGLYAAGGTVTLRNSTVTNNAAIAGAGGLGGTTRNGKHHDGAAGKALGGGLYFDAAASAGLDAFTKSHVTLNTASSGKNDIYGSYRAIA